MLVPPKAINQLNKIIEMLDFEPEDRIELNQQGDLYVRVTPVWSLLKWNEEKEKWEICKRS